MMSKSTSKCHSTMTTMPSECYYVLVKAKTVIFPTCHHHTQNTACSSNSNSFSQNYPFCFTKDTQQSCTFGSLMGYGTMLLWQQSLPDWFSSSRRTTSPTMIVRHSILSFSNSDSGLFWSVESSPLYKGHFQAPTCRNIQTGFFDHLLLHIKSSIQIKAMQNKYFFSTSINIQFILLNLQKSVELQHFQMPKNRPCH